MKYGPGYEYWEAEHFRGLSREEFEKEDDQYHAMIMKYEWLHFWKTWEIKLKTIFGEPDNPVPQTKEGPVDDYEWKPGKAIERFNDPAFLENVKKL